MGRTKKYETKEEYLAANREKARARYYTSRGLEVPPLRRKPTKPLSRTDKHNLRVINIVKDDINSMIDYYELKGGITDDRTLARMATKMIKKLLDE